MAKSLVERRLELSRLQENSPSAPPSTCGCRPFTNGTRLKVSRPRLPPMSRATTSTSLGPIENAGPAPRAPRLHRDQLGSMSKRSATCLSKRSPYIGLQVSASLSWTLMRIWLPARCTEPSGTEFAADLLQIDMLSLVGEGGVAADREDAGQPRQIRSQALGPSINWSQVR
jgi:hypothetical protein